jgi:hypothetical protein
MVIAEIKRLLAQVMFLMLMVLVIITLVPMIILVSIIKRLKHQLLIKQRKLGRAAMVAMALMITLMLQLVK